MFEGYHIQNRYQALKAITKEVYVPQARLGIQEGESLNAFDIKAEMVRGRQVLVIPELSKTPYERAHIDQQAAQVNPEDFPKSGYLGEVLGGI